MRTCLVIAALVAAASPAAADTFGGWRFTVPAGYDATDSSTQVRLQKNTPPAFCAIMLYSPRAMTGSLTDEAAAEWTNVVERNYKTSGVRHHGKGTTKSALAFHATAGTIEDTSGQRFSAILYGVSTAKQVSSVLLVSTSNDEITKCRAALTSFLDSLSLAPGSAPAPPPPPAETTAKPAVEIAGEWSTSSASADPRTGEMRDGSTTRQYKFATNGTYRFYSENWGGQFDSETWRLVAETGTYKLAGDKLTLTPAKVTGTQRKKGVATRYKPPVEKMTYTVTKHYFEGIQEWNLVLTPTAKTARDGEFAANASFKSSYLYRDGYKPAWKYPP